MNKCNSKECNKKYYKNELCKEHYEEYQQLVNQILPLARQIQEMRLILKDKRKLKI